MTGEIYYPIIQEEARANQIHPNWVAAIIQKESLWNPWVIRFEKGYSYLYAPQKFTGSLNSLNTETQAQKTSWGLGQLMGGLVREMGHIGFLPEILKPELNIKFVCKRLGYLATLSFDPSDIFAMYNGGPGAKRRLSDGKYFNQEYVDDVTRNLQLFTL